MVYGIDARLMFDGNKVAPVKTGALSSKVMEISKMPLFANVFKKQEKKDEENPAEAKGE